MPQTPNPVHAEIQNLENRRYDAVLSQNFDTLAGLCHADLIYGHSGGNHDSLDEYLGKLRTGALRYEHIDHAVDSIVIVGDAALVIGEMRAALTVNGRKKTINNSCLAVWTKENGDWKFIAYQPTPQLP